MEDNTRHNTNSVGGSQQFLPDPIIQAKDDSNRFHKGLQPMEIVHSANKPMSVADATLLPNQFMGIGEPTQTPLSSNDIIKSMFRFKWTILAIFILVAAPAIAVIWTQVVPKYRAKAEIRVRPIIPRLVFRTEENGMIPLYNSFVNTQVSIMRSLTVLQRVLDQQEVQQTQWYKNPQQPLVQSLLKNPLAPSIERLRNNLSVQPRRRTEIIDIALIDSSAKDAKIIVDAVLDQYIQYIGETSDATKDVLYKTLSGQYKTLDTEIKGQEKIAIELSKSLGTEIPDELISSMRLRLEETQDRLSKLQQSIAILKWKMKQAGADDSNDLPVALTDKMEKQPKYYEDTEWRALDVNARAIRHKMATGLLTPKHQNVTLMEKELKFTEELLRLRESQLDGQWRDQLKNASGVPITNTNANSLGYEEGLISLEYQLARAEYEEQLLLAEFDTHKADFEKFFESAQLLKKENNILQHKRELFSAVRQRLDQKNMERNVPGSIDVLMRTFVSSRPYNDRRIVFTAMTLVMALGMGGGIAFLRGSRNQSIYTHNDMPYPTQVPFLGYIPMIRNRRSPDDEISSDVSEAFRIMRTALLARLNGQGNPSVLVTSSEASTGKSTFTMMLGKSLAQAGKKVLMIDADFRRKSLTNRFNLLDKFGFLESLYCKSVDRRHIIPTETIGLNIMPAGKRSNDDNVFEETANGAFKACIDQLRNQYNVILLDSSPILPVADATILSSQVDGIIMVERELISQRGNVINAIARLGSSGGHLLGTVIVGSSNMEGYGYNFNYSRTGES